MSTQVTFLQVKLQVKRALNCRNFFIHFRITFHELKSAFGQNLLTFERKKCFTVNWRQWAPLFIDKIYSKLMQKEISSIIANHDTVYLKKRNVAEHEFQLGKQSLTKLIHAFNPWTNNE